MRGKITVLLSAAVILILASSVSSAQDALALSVDKTLSPGVSRVEFAGVIYRVYSLDNCTIEFEMVDRDHHRVYVIPINPFLPYCDVVLQWNGFTPVTLDLQSGSGNSWLLGVETGYAEK